MTRLVKFISILFILLWSCDSEEPRLYFSDGVLHYDGENQDAPVLAAGQNEVAARFPAELLNPLVGRRLTEIDFFMYDIPGSCLLTVYEGGINSPGSIIYTVDIKDDLIADQWNTHILDQDLEIGNENLWISLTFDNPSSAKLIGCDAGPQDVNGARILRGSSRTWDTFEFNINWNIRGILED